MYLDAIIGPQQTGYVPGRFIGTNIWKMIDIIMYVKKEQIPAAFVSVDFHKCFDSIEYDALLKSLYYFNFGDYLISWVKFIYEDFTLCVINNGQCSPFFQQTHGVHQGCALSGPIYLCVAETLAHRIQNNPKIKGIKIQELEEKLGQYADDTGIFSLCEVESLQEIINELEYFHSNTGLQSNYEKTKVYAIGKNEKKPKLSKKLRWAEGPIDALGLIITVDDYANMQKINYKDVLDKMQSVISQWSGRHATLTGKVQLVNTLIAFLFVYKMQLLPNMHTEIVSKIEEQISRFIWNGRKPKLRNKVLALSRNQGGLKLVDIGNRDKALKIQWVRRLHDKDPVLTSLAYYMLDLPIKSELLWDCNFSKEDISEHVKLQSFWKSVIIDWAEYNYCENIVNPEQMLEQVLWYNSNIKVAGHLYIDSTAMTNGIIKVHDMFNENGRICSYQKMSDVQFSMVHHEI